MSIILSNRKRIKMIFKKRKFSEEHKRKLREAAKKQWQEKRDIMIVAFNRPEVRFKNSLRTKKQWQEKRDIMIASMNRPEVKAKKSKSAKLVAARPEVKAKKIANAKKMWRENREKIISAMNQPEVKVKVSKLLKGRPSWSKGLTKETDERVAKHSKALMGHEVFEVTRKKLSDIHKIVMNLPEVKAKVSKANKISQNRPETKAKKSKIMKAMWENPQFIEKQRIGKQLRPNNLEQFFDRQTPECVKYVGDYKLRIKTNQGSLFPDFIVEKTKKIIEIFGDFWHEGENPAVLIEKYASAGWQCKVFWEHEIYNDNKRILEEILEFIGK